IHLVCHLRTTCSPQNITCIIADHVVLPPPSLLQAVSRAQCNLARLAQLQPVARGARAGSFRCHLQRHRRSLPVTGLQSPTSQWSFFRTTRAPCKCPRRHRYLPLPTREGLAWPLLLLQRSEVGVVQNISRETWPVRLSARLQTLQYQPTVSQLPSWPVPTSGDISAT
ncbi:uncharacterized protein B0I36DRAFT_433203, partial [Microdochium trichocladiopsis]